MTAASPSENLLVFVGVSPPDQLCTADLLQFSHMLDLKVPIFRVREFAFRKFPAAECRELALSPTLYRGEPILSYSRACQSWSCRRKGRGEGQERVDSSLTD